MHPSSQQTAVITGGAGGLGRAIAARLAQRIGRIAVWDVDERASEAAALLPDAVGIAVDVTDEEAVARAMERTLDQFGRLDILVTAAGITGPNQPLTAYSFDEWRRVMAINLDGTFLCCRAAVPIMERTGQGRIVNIASIAGKEGNPNASCYSASKAGVIALTKSLGKELAATDIRVNCIAPAAIETELLKQMSPEFTAYVISKIPLGRLGRAEEVASMVDWLCSPECSFSTGAVFDLSGGRATY